MLGHHMLLLPCQLFAVQSRQLESQLAQLRSQAAEVEDHSSGTYLLTCVY
jgi:hypothetical protein